MTELIYFSADLISRNERKKQKLDFTKLLVVYLWPEQKLLYSKPFKPWSKLSISSPNLIIGCYRTQHFSVVVVHTCTLPFFLQPHCNCTRTQNILFECLLTPKKLKKNLEIFFSKFFFNSSKAFGKFSSSSFSVTTQIFVEKFFFKFFLIFWG